MYFVKEWLSILIPSEGFRLFDLWQIGLILAGLYINNRLVSGKCNPLTKSNPSHWIRSNFAFILLWLEIILAYGLLDFVYGLSTPVLQIFASLSTIWIVIGLLTSLIRDRFCANSIAGLLYLATAFGTLSEIEYGVKRLKDVYFNLGTLEISAWAILAGIVAFVFTLWISLALARVIETQIQNVPQISDSLKVLIAKIIRIIFIVMATLIALGSVGIDLSTFTVLSGAIGLGLGFGLQKVISNFVSGIILLTDNSIKPGDVIEIDGTYGWINNLRARYASVITRDGTEHLIPNEDLITQRVINWSFTDKLVRMKIPIGVAYGSDPHKCIELIIEAAKAVNRVLHAPSPVCLLKGFGDNSVDLELRFWLSDPSNGVSNVKSKVLLNIWDTFKKNNIEIPFPQRDLHIRSSNVQNVSFSKTDSK